MATTIRKSDIIQTAAAVVAVLMLGFGTATAAISVAPKAEANPAYRPLTIGRSIQVQPAYGPDDEDCTWATHKIVQANGKIRIDRRLVCDQ